MRVTLGIWKVTPSSSKFRRKVVRDMGTRIDHQAGAWVTVLFAALLVAPVLANAAEIFVYRGLHGEDVYSDRPPNKGGVVIATQPVPANRSAAAVAGERIEVGTAEASDTPYDAPPAMAEPYQAGGVVAQGKSFTLGD
jgi:hypothetical protein